jgi:hypothetical protein
MMLCRPNDLLKTNRRSAARSGGLTKLQSRRHHVRTVGSGITYATGTDLMPDASRYP